MDESLAMRCGSQRRTTGPLVAQSEHSLLWDKQWVGASHKRHRAQNTWTRRIGISSKAALVRIHAEASQRAERRRLPNQGTGRAQAEEALSSVAPEKARTWQACVRVASSLLAWSVRSQYFLRGVTSPGEQGRCSQCGEASIRSSEELDRSHLHPQPSARGAAKGLELGIGTGLCGDGRGRLSVVWLCAGLDE